MGLFTSTLLLAAALQVQNATQTQNATEAGRFHVEHATLLNAGFEWAITGDANRNATVSVQFRAVGETAWRNALPLVRIGGENVYRRRENLDYTVPDGFAGSILNLAPGTEYECRFQLADPDGDDRRDDSRCQGEDAHRADAIERRPHAPRLPARLPGPADRAELYERSSGVLRRRPRRLERGVGAPRPARRHHPGARRPLQARTVQLRRSDDDAVRRLDVADAEGDERKAHHDQSRRRRRGHLRRRRQCAIVRRDGVELSHLRRPHLSQHRRRHLRRPERGAGRGRSHGEELPLRKRRARASGPSTPAPAISTLRTICSSAATIASASSDGPGLYGPAQAPMALICSKAITP